MFPASHTEASPRAIGIDLWQSNIERYTRERVAPVSESKIVFRVDR